MGTGIARQKGMKDAELLRKKRKLYDLAHGAAFILLAEDRRFLGATSFRDKIAHTAALRAIGSTTSLGHEFATAAKGGDPLGVDMLWDGYNKACAAAKRAVDETEKV